MKFLLLLFGFLSISISAYSLLTKDFSYGPVSILFLAVMYLLLGIRDMKMNGKRGYGVYIILAALAAGTLGMFSL